MDQTEHAVLYDLSYYAGTVSFLNVICIKYASDNGQCSYSTHQNRYDQKSMYFGRGLE